MYEVQAKDGSTTKDVISDIIIINNIRVGALLDINASHSFTNWLFAEWYGIRIIPTLHPQRILVFNHTLNIQKFCLSCHVWVADWIMLTDLFALPKMGEFNVILGMNWLIRYHATIDCKSQSVIFVSQDRRK